MCLNNSSPNGSLGRDKKHEDNETKLSCGGVATSMLSAVRLLVSFLNLKIILHAFLILTTGTIFMLANKNDMYNSFTEYLTDIHNRFIHCCIDIPSLTPPMGWITWCSLGR